jgi:hypothetical protein
MQTLFELRTDDDLRRDAVADNERHIHEVLLGHGPWALTERQRKILECLRGRQGRLLAMPIGDLVAKLAVDPRSIKADVRELVVTFGLAIVASRDGETGGYYFAVSAEERVAGTADYLKEAVKLIRRAAVIRNETDMQTLLGQVALDLRQAEERVSR